MMTPNSTSCPSIASVLLAALLAAGAAFAQAPAPSSPASSSPTETTPGTPAPATPAASDPSAASASSTPAAADAPPRTLEALEWLRGCWQGRVNQREFREQWLPGAGGMMIGAGHTVRDGKTQDYEYLRIESRPDGVYYVTVPSGQKEATFRLTETSRDETSGAQIFTFTNVASEFPQRIVYRRGGEGWLYAGIEGVLNGEERKVIYPMRHQDCLSGAILQK
jgi:hypothetical protein